MHLSSVVSSGNKTRKLFHPGRKGSFRCLCCWTQRRKEFLFIKSNHSGSACCKAHRKDTSLKNYNCEPSLPVDICISIISLSVWGMGVVCVCVLFWGDSHARKPVVIFSSWMATPKENKSCYLNFLQLLGFCSLYWLFKNRLCSWCKLFTKP